VDDLIHQYFDEKLVPYNNTIDLYYEYFVNKGNLDPVLKKKLRDICYYLIEVVIPNIPSVDNPNPKVEWSRIEWLSDGWDSYNYSFNDDALSNLKSFSALRYRLGSNHANSENEDESSASGLSLSSRIPSTTPSSTKPVKSNAPLASAASAGSNGGGSSCNGSCPIDCNLSEKLAQSSGSSYLETVASSVSRPNWWDSKINYDSALIDTNSYGEFSDSIYEGTARAGTFKSKGYNPTMNTIYQVIVTNVKNTNVSSQILNNYVKNEIINKWFDTAADPDKPLPSKYAISIFESYTQGGLAPMDRTHKNRLRDFIYYYLENIIPGLPTKDVPFSKVEWRPLRYLSNSSL
jgi:hypothetical protein